MHTVRYFAILLMGLFVGTASASAPAGHVTVDGYGRTKELARTVALDNAQDKVLALVRERLGPGWQPAPGQLDVDYLVKVGVVRPRGEPVQQKVEGIESWKALCDVELTSSYLSLLKDSARMGRIEARYWLLGRVLAGLVVVLLVTTGYLRLEQLTAGYYTRLLRVGAITLVTLTGVALVLSLWPF